MYTYSTFSAMLKIIYVVSFVLIKISLSSINTCQFQIVELDLRGLSIYFVSTTPSVPY